MSALDKTARVSHPIRCVWPSSIVLRVVTHADGRVSLNLDLRASRAKVHFTLDPAGAQELRSALDIPPLLMVETPPPPPATHPDVIALAAHLRRACAPQEEPLCIIGQGDSQREIHG